MAERQFAYTGPSPATGYVGYVNVKEDAGGVRFTVRSEGAEPVTASLVIDRTAARDLLANAAAGLAE